jgi:hypothetical protein
VTVVEGVTADSAESVIVVVEDAVMAGMIAVDVPAVVVSVDVLAPIHWLFEPQVRPFGQQPPPREEAHEVKEGEHVEPTTEVWPARVIVVVLVT